MTIGHTTILQDNPELAPSQKEYVTTWRLLGQPTEPGEVQAESRRGTVSITQAHVDYARHECQGFCIVVLVPAPDSSKENPRWEIDTIGGQPFLPGR